MTNADLLARQLKEEGVPIFGVLGATNAPLLAAIGRTCPELYVQMCSELNATLAAGGYARASGRAAVALVSGGPGALMATPGIQDANVSCFPMVVLLGQERSDLCRRHVTHECNHEAVLSPLCKEFRRVADDDDMVFALTWAVYESVSGRPGVIVLEIPVDVQGSEGTVGDAGMYPSLDMEARVDCEPLERMAIVLQEAERPAILAGGGVVAAQAGPMLSCFAGRVGAAVLLTHTAFGAVMPDDPCYAGLAVAPYSRRIWEECDAMLMIGTRLPGMVCANWSYPQPTWVGRVDVDDEPIDGYREDVFARCDAAVALTAMCSAIHPNRRGHWHSPPTCLIEPWELAMVEAVERHIPQEWTITTGCNTFGALLGSGWNVMRRPRRLIRASGFDMMGQSIPFAIGAWRATRHPSFWIVGDGELLFNPADIGTMVSEFDPCIGLLVKNGSYDLVRRGSMAGQKSDFGCWLPDHDLAEKILAAHGIARIHTDPEGFEAALPQALCFDSPVCVVLELPREDRPTVRGWVPDQQQGK